MSTDSTLAVQGGTPALSNPLPAWPIHDSTDAEALVEVLNSGKWGSTAGTVVRTFEAEFAETFGSAHAFAVSNGTLALAAALSAGGIGTGDEVIVPPYTFIATAAAALFVGAVPVFADVLPDNHLLDPKAVEAAITERTKAIIPVHLAGAVADMDAFAEIGRRHDLLIIEDCAQAIGAEWKGTPVGALAGIGTFSFQSSKNLTAGEGGMVVTNDDQLATGLFSAINVGRVLGGGWYEHATVGYNLRLTEFQGALLRVQLSRLADQQKVRDENARLLTELLSGVAGVTVDTDPEGMTAHGRHLFMMRMDAVDGDGALRDKIVEALVAEGLPASSGYVPLNQNEALLTAARKITDRLGQPYLLNECPVGDQVSTDTVWLAQPALLGATDQTHEVATAIAKVLGQLDQLR
ncbi:DegT/DnrJ/EryC1/StrS family aminotransferase [Propionibacteriaceae bacterium Y1700]|uniref:DegT/DnrJ/EryC1/StrS family aminotransferase n=1 Tax=Microlunatus sp. Y1700 TaxID=3418487 RepID=UPI003DA7099E